MKRKHIHRQQRRLEPVSRPRGLVGQTHGKQRIHKRKRRKKTNGFVPKNRRNGKTKKKTRNFLLFLFLLFFFPVHAFNPPHQPLFTHCAMMAMWHQAKENNFISVLFSLIIIIYPPNIHAHYHVDGYLHINDAHLDCQNARVVIIDLLFDDINHSDESRKRRPPWPDGRGWSGRRVIFFFFYSFFCMPC